MRILIPGCAGFIGFHMASRLLNEGHEIVGLDNFVSGRRENVQDLAKNAQFSFIEADMSQPFAVGGPVDQIYNFACPASPIDFAGKRLEILAVCSQGVLNLLQLAAEKGARMLHTSTSEVYGNPLVHPQKETYFGNVNPIGPRACYDEGKRYAEALITSFTAIHSVETRIVRIFNTYGPRMRPNDGRALPAFISQAMADEPITVHGDGSQTRSFCYVSDQVEGQIRLMNSDVVGPVNIGNPCEITMLDVAKEVVELMGSKSEIVFVDRPKDDPNLRKPDITRARETLGWEPTVDRREGLGQTIEWFRSVVTR